MLFDTKGAPMPAVTVLYPRNFFMDPTDKIRFKRTVKRAVAVHMDAIDPSSKTGEKTKYGEDPDKFIDLVLIPYDHDDAEVTTPFLATIVTYDWPDRMADLSNRIDSITQWVRRYLDPFVSQGEEVISFTFLGKVPGAWAVA